MRARLSGAFGWAIMAGACLCLASDPVSAAPPAKAPAERAQTYSFAFRDAEIAKVVEEVIGNTLHLPYTVDPAVTGKMSFRIDQKLTRAQLFDALEAALATSDVVMTRNGDSLLVQPRAKAKTAPSFQTSTGERPHRAGYQTVAVPLSFATPSEVAKALASVAPASAVVSTDDKLGLIVLGGTDREIDSLLQAVRVFDQSGLQANRIRFFELNRAPAESVAEELTHLLQGSGDNGVTVVPMKRMNGLYVFARSARALDEVGEWITRLDTPSKDVAAAFWVYHPHSVSADSLAHTLGSLMFGDTGGSRPGTAVGTSTIAAGPAPAIMPLAPGSPSASSLGGLGALSQAVGSAPGAPTGPSLASGPMASADGSVRLGVDAESNTLLIAAPEAQWIQIQKILGEIDRPPKQILIEASIVEVTLTDDTKLGVDWSWMNGGTTVTSSGASNGAVAPSFPGFTVTFLNSDIKAALSTLGSRSSVEVVSAPKILTLNNRPAMLEVGNQVPVITQSAQTVTAAGAPVVNSVDYRSTGVILNVTPQITDEDSVLLTVSQEVSSVASTTTSSINSPTISQRRFQSTLVLKDHGTVALGGLISHTNGRGSSGLPFLSDAPVIGALFGSQKYNHDRTELIVLLSATIVKDQPSMDAALANLQADMHELQKRGLFKTNPR